MVAGHGDEELMRALMRKSVDLGYFDGKDILRIWWKERRKGKEKGKRKRKRNYKKRRYFL